MQPPRRDAGVRLDRVIAGQVAGDIGEDAISAEPAVVPRRCDADGLEVADLVRPDLLDACAGDRDSAECQQAALQLAKHIEKGNIPHELIEQGDAAALLLHRVAVTLRAPGNNQFRYAKILVFREATSPLPSPRRSGR